MKHYLYQIYSGRKYILNIDKLIEIINMFFKWKYYLEQSRNPIDDELPWLTFSSIDQIKSHINHDSRVFEYGAGGSTLFFAKSVTQLVTVENDIKWAKVVNPALIKNENMDDQILLVVPEQNQRDTLLNSDEIAYISESGSYRGKVFKNYVEVIDKFPDNYFNLILIDGRARKSCIVHSIPKLCSNGLLILDNSEREEYIQSVNSSDLVKWKRKDHWGPGPYNDYFWRTTIWTKSLN